MINNRKKNEWGIKMNDNQLRKKMKIKDLIKSLLGNKL